MKKYSVFILVVVFTVVLISGCVSEEETPLAYKNNSISFNYSPSWIQTDAQFSSSLKTKSKILVNLIDASDSEIGFCVEKHPLLTGNDLQTNFKTVIKSYKKSGHNILNQNESTIGGEKAFTILFSVNNSHPFIQKEYWCKHNDSLYTIAFFAEPEKFNESKKDFDMVINSFKFY